jgi:hypothetical protein
MSFAPNSDDRTPGLGKSAFICPHCQAFCQQEWLALLGRKPESEPGEYDLDHLDSLIHNTNARLRQATEGRKDEIEIELKELNRIRSAVAFGDPASMLTEQSTYGVEVLNFYVSSCLSCERSAVWIADRIIHPHRTADAPEANSDLPADIRRDYEEAARVLPMSPRSAVALLRLAIQKLCSHVLGRKGDINTMIADLVKKGLNPKIQQALDVVRVIGNEAVHPGTLDLRDDQATATRLFLLVNIIADAMISQERHVRELYEVLPTEKLEAIAKRDKPKG